MTYVNADVSDDIHQKLHVWAAEEDKKMEEVVREAIERGITQQKTQ